MIHLTVEITDTVLADGTTIYIPVHRWSKRDKVPYLGHIQIRSHNVGLLVWYADARLTRPHALTLYFSNISHIKTLIKTYLESVECVLLLTSP